MYHYWNGPGVPLPRSGVDQMDQNGRRPTGGGDTTAQGPRAVGAPGSRLPPGGHTTTRCIHLLQGYRPSGTALRFRDMGHVSINASALRCLPCPRCPLVEWQARETGGGERRRVGIPPHTRGSEGADLQLVSFYLGKRRARISFEIKNRPICIILLLASTSSCIQYSRTMHSINTYELVL